MTARFTIKRTNSGVVSATIPGKCKHKQTMTLSVDCFSHLLPRNSLEHSGHEYAELIGQHYDTSNPKIKAVVEALEQE